MSRLLSPLLLLAAFAGACAVSESDRPDAAPDAERGALGKADVFGSCLAPNGDDQCGGHGVGNCWCDDLCVDYGDCCEDAADVCEIDDAGDDGEVCGDVLCALACEHGFKTDDNGCEICECQGQFCGGIAAIQCPPGEVCVGVGDFPDAGGFCEPAPPEPEEPSCEGACGGQSDDGCWCDELCSGFGDCCGDYEDVCAAEPEPNCGEETCGGDEVCVTHVTQTGFVFSCAEVDPACDGEASCGCMGEQVCTGAFNLCSDGEAGLSCSCPVC